MKLYWRYSGMKKADFRRYKTGPFQNKNPAQYLVVGGSCIWPAKNQFITLNTAVKRVPVKSGN